MAHAAGQRGRSGAGAGSVTLPAAVLRARNRGAITGRDQELSGLESAWAAATGPGPVGLVLLEGEPGVGKTRLAAEQSARAVAAGGAALFGRCDPEVPAPFRPWLGVLGDLVMLADEDLLAAHTRDHGGALARILGTIGERLPDPPADDTDPDAQRHRLLGAAVGLLVAAAQQHPLLIVLDDLQFADRASLLLLRELLRGPDAPILVLATIRYVESDHGDPFRALGPELRREPAARTIALGGLDLPATRELVVAELGEGEQTDRLARDLLAKTDGNALFVVELLRHRAELGEDAARQPPPRTITEVVDRRASQLGVKAAAVAHHAAALGRTFDFDLLVHVLDEPPETVLDALEGICDAGLAAEIADRPGRFQFAHAIIQEALAAEVSGLRRRQLHRRAAEWLAAAGDRDVVRSGELALHWASAGSAFAEQAVGAAVEAADQALDMLAPDDAVRALQQALGLHEQVASEPDDQTTELFLRLGDAERLAGHDGYAGHLLQAAELAQQRGDTERLVRAAIANSRGFHASFLSTDKRRVAVLEAALEAVGDAPRERSLLLAVLASELFADRARRVALADEALAAAREAGDQRVLAEVLFRRCFTIAEPGTVAERLRLAAELRRLAERLDDPMVRLRAALESARVLFEAGRTDAVDEARRLIELAPHTGSAFAAYLATHFEAVLLQREGRYEEAETAALRGAERGAAVAPDAMAIFSALVLAIRWDQGRLGELAEAAVELASQPGLDLGHRALIPLALAEAGREDDSRQALDAAVQDGLPVPENALALVAATLWAEGCVRIGHRAGAELALERLAPWRELYVFSGSSLMGCVARPCAALAALLGRDDAAARDFRLAEAIDARVGAVGPQARTWLDHGRWLLTQGDAEQGRDRLERARGAAAEHGFAGLLAAAEAALGAPARSTAGRASAELTREGDVWTLDFDGRITRLKDAKGLHHLVALLRSPGVEQHALDLVGGGGTTTAASAEGLEVRADTGDAGPALDDQAKRQYRARLEELREELEEAEAFNDPERAARAREELEWIGQALSQAVGLGGRDRPQSSDAERARVNVTRAIKTVVKRVAEHDERAARALDKGVRTGLFCVYEPDPDRPIDWRLPD